MSTNSERARNPISRPITRLLVVLMLVAAACAGNTDSGDAALAAEPEEAVPDQSPAADDEPVEEEPEPVEEEPEPVEEEQPGQDEPVSAETVSVPNVGTSIDIDFSVPTQSVSGTGASVLGRTENFSPFSSFMLFFRATGFADAAVQGDNSAAQPFTGTFEDFLEVPELDIVSESEATVSGFDATVVDFSVIPSDNLIADCGPPPTDQCALVASSPDSGNFDAIFARTSHTLRLWRVDQGEELPLVILSASAEGDDAWREIAEEAIESIVLGDPQPAPS